MYATRRSMMIGGISALAADFTEVSASERQRPPVPLGVNLCGAEFKAIAGAWHWPNMNNVNYYLGKRMKIFRIPFLWERLQPDPDGELSPSAMSGLDALVGRIRQAGATAVLDCHNFGRRDGHVIGEPGGAPTRSFAAFWGRLAKRYADDPSIWYGLMNEPHRQDPEINLSNQNAACYAVRQSGARGLVLFSGIAWTGAHSWVKSGNSVVMARAVDPGDNCAFDVHQYLDKGFGGSSDIPVSGAGAKTLVDVHDWARRLNKKLFVGEFASGRSVGAIMELDDLVRFIVRRGEVFVGATYFAGGGVWGGHNTTTSDPSGSGSPLDQPQTQLLTMWNAAAAFGT